jgi:hypothetical protein
MDEGLDADEPLTGDNVDMLMNESVFLLLPAERGGEFGERYMAALQRDPHVVLAHAKVAKRIGSSKPHAWFDRSIIDSCKRLRAWLLAAATPAEKSDAGRSVWLCRCRMRGQSFSRWLLATLLTR